MIVAASISLASDELEPLKRGLSCISTFGTPSVIHQITFGGHRNVRYRVTSYYYSKYHIVISAIIVHMLPHE